MDLGRGKHVVNTLLQRLDHLLDLLRGDVERRREQDVVAAHAVCCALSEARVHRDAPVEDGVVEQRCEREIHGESRLGLLVPDKLEGLEQAPSPDLADMRMITERGFECSSQLDETSAYGPGSA